MTSRSQAETLDRIASALQAAQEIFRRFTPGEIEAEYKSGHDPVTEADKAVDAALREQLLRGDEGWLSEESVDDFTRLEKSRVWVVDPLDGTREFVAGIPEFCVSVAMVENGRPVAGGICNPATEEIFLGSLDSGLTYNGELAHASQRKNLEGAVILASRSETARGEWKQFENAPFRIGLMGSVAYKLALVSAGLADATFTLTPKHEWDVAGGAALVESAGGLVRTLDGQLLLCNRKPPKLSGLVAAGSVLYDELRALLDAHIPATSLRPQSS
jgi:myo-inositol-1(or 4)-monophosphatase